MKSGEVKLFTTILIVAMVLVGIAIYPTLRPPEPPKRPEVQKIDRAVLVPPGARIKGDPKAPFTLVEFGDYQCPTCKGMQEVVDEVLARYKGKLKLVYHHYKVSQSHEHSNKLAMAAFAAEQQGKFWEMHRALYDDQSSFSVTDPKLVVEEVTRLAVRLKLDALSFRSAMGSDAVLKEVQEDAEAGQKANVDGTPWFFFLKPAGDPIQVPHLQLQQWLDNPANWK